MAGIFLNGRLYGTDEPNPSSIQIKPWSPETSYQAGTIVLHAYNFYQCMEDNNDALFNLEKWRLIGSSEGNYGIVSSTSYLPLTFGAGDLKIYYCTEDMNFYLWTGSAWEVQRKKASYSELGSVIIDEETLQVDANGKLSIRTISNEQVNNLF